MSRVPGTNLIATRTAPRIDTFVANGTISAGDLVYMASGDKVDTIAAGTNILVSNTVTSLGGVVGVAITPGTANGAIQVQIIDSDCELVLPFWNQSSGSGQANVTPTTAGNTLYALIKPSSASTGATAAGIVNALCVDLATTSSGLVNVINKDQDALGMARLTTGSAAGVFTDAPALSLPTLPIAITNLVRVIIPEGNRWYKG